MKTFFDKLKLDGHSLSSNELRCSLHKAGNALVIDDLYIHPDYRRKGIGTRWFNYLLEIIPADIERIELFAADYDGSGNSNEFWESLGFDFKYTADDESEIDYEDQWIMVVGVNGHDTPNPIHISSDATHADDDQNECDVANEIATDNSTIGRGPR